MLGESGTGGFTASIGSRVMPDARGDHLSQGLQAGRPETFLLAGACQAADLQRLVAQAVAVFQ